MKSKMFFVFAIAIGLFIGCSSSKETKSMKASRDNLKGTWEIVDIQANLPQGYSVTNVFDAAPYADFRNSVWKLVRNGNGTYTLPDGRVQNIYWSSSGRAGEGQFQFKKIESGQNPANVTTGYILYLQDLDADRFTAVSDISLSEGRTGSITYVFERQ